ncbi:hypothetical protein BGZ49_004584, partial [Haplosporangium sp. Z 27]
MYIPVDQSNKIYSCPLGAKLVQQTRIKMRLQLLTKLVLVTLGTTRAAIINVPIEDHIVNGIVSVGIGNPPTTYQLLVDTGSANSWLGANQAYVKTSTSVKTSDSVTLANVFSGVEYLDQVSIGDLVISSQSIGVATTVSRNTDFHGIDGFLGLGPADLSVGTLSPETEATIPTVVDNLFSNGAITANEIAISFVPSTSANNDENGQITFGGTDSGKFTGEITYVLITGTSPANQYWGLDASFRYGSGTNILQTTAGIIDTGTTLLLLATDAFQKFQQATGGIMDRNTGLLTITSDQYTNLQSLFLQVGNTNFEITPNALIWPRNLNTQIGGTAGNIYLVVADSKSNSGEGLDFII